MSKLTNENFLIHAAQHYNNPQCFDTEEFYGDIRRIKYIKRLVNKYVSSGELKERLIINHIMILSNMFGPEMCVRMIYLFNKNSMNILKPFLLLLGLMPDKITDVGDEDVVFSSDIEMDPVVVEKVRQI